MYGDHVIRANISESLHQIYILNLSKAYIYFKSVSVYI